MIAQNWYVSTLTGTIADDPVLKDINIGATLEIWKSDGFDGICFRRDQDLGTVPGLRQAQKLLAQYISKLRGVEDAIDSGLKPTFMSKGQAPEERVNKRTRQGATRSRSVYLIPDPSDTTQLTMATGRRLHIRQRLFVMEMLVYELSIQLTTQSMLKEDLAFKETADNFVPER